jgi:glutamine synthetase type III
LNSIFEEETLAVDHTVVGCEHHGFESLFHEKFKELNGSEHNNWSLATDTDNG